MVRRHTLRNFLPFLFLLIVLLYIPLFQPSQGRWLSCLLPCSFFLPFCLENYYFICSSLCHLTRLTANIFTLFLCGAENSNANGVTSKRRTRRRGLAASAFSATQYNSTSCLYTNIAFLPKREGLMRWRWRCRHTFLLQMLLVPVSVVFSPNSSLCVCVVLLLLSPVHPVFPIIYYHYYSPTLRFYSSS